MNGQYQVPYNGYQQSMQQPSYSPVPYNPLAANEQRMNSILQNNPQLAAQYQTPQPQPLQQAAQAALLKGRAVSGMDEAKAAQIDFDGSVHVFTDIPNGKIYTKQIGLDGAAMFNTFLIQPPEPAPLPVSGNELSELRAKISELEAKIDNMGGAANVQSTANTGATRNAPKQRQSDGDDSANGGK